MLLKVKTILKKWLVGIKNKLNLASTWLKEKDYLSINITSSRIVKAVSFSIPIYAILYLTIFYKHFNIRYFIYFHPLDFLQAFYGNNIFFIALFSSALVCSSIFQIYYYSSNRRLPINSIFIVLIILQVLTGCFLFISYVDQRIITLVLLFVILLSNYFIIKFKYLSTIIYSYIFMIPFSAMYIGKITAVTIEKNKNSFDIILNDNSFLLEENDKCNYFIGSTTNYVFIYDYNIEKVRATPVKNIKEIRFKRPNKTKKTTAL